MRNIAKPLEIPAELIDEQAQRQFVQILANKKISESDCKIYRKVKLQLLELYEFKCCYCESKLSGTEIEHFRPKSEYYWLVFSWDNILPVCSQCNKNKNKGFFTEFPKIVTDAIITVIQAQNKIHNYNELEKPLLVNPEIDTILDDTLSFEKNGTMKSSNEFDKFSKTIELLKLNRPELLRHRKKMFDELHKKIAGLAIVAREDEITNAQKKIMQELVVDANSVENDYIALRKFLISYYRSLLLNEDLK